MLIFKYIDFHKKTTLYGSRKHLKKQATSFWDEIECRSSSAQTRQIIRSVRKQNKDSPGKNCFRVSVLSCFWSGVKNSLIQRW